MNIKAYVQTVDGDEVELEVTQPDPSEAALDKCVCLSEEALNMLTMKGGWIRVVSK